LTDPNKEKNKYEKIKNCRGRVPSLPKGKELNKYENK